MSVRSDPHRTIPGAGCPSWWLATNFLVPPATLQVSANALARAFSKLWKLARAGVDDRLYLLLGLLRNRDYPV